MKFKVHIVKKKYNSEHASVYFLQEKNNPRFMVYNLPAHEIEMGESMPLF